MHTFLHVSTQNGLSNTETFTLYDKKIKILCLVMTHYSRPQLMDISLWFITQVLTVVALHQLKLSFQKYNPVNFTIKDVHINNLGTRPTDFNIYPFIS